MSQVNPKIQKLDPIWLDIKGYASQLARSDNGNTYKWYTFASYVQINCLIEFQSDWQAEMVRYYCRLCSYKPRENQKQYYDQLLQSIDKLVGLLND